jgi:hypothetical protein
MSELNANNNEYDSFENKNKRVRVWMRKDTGELGYALPDTWLGPVWFFAEHRMDEVLNHQFCNFVDDPLDDQSLPRKAFVDLGPL